MRVYASLISEEGLKEGYLMRCLWVFGSDEECCALPAKQLSESDRQQPGLQQSSMQNLQHSWFAEP